MEQGKITGKKIAAAVFGVLLVGRLTTVPALGTIPLGSFMTGSGVQEA